MKFGLSLGRDHAFAEAMIGEGAGPRGHRWIRIGSRNDFEQTTGIAAG